jgi:hypothetical protein
MAICEIGGVAFEVNEINNLGGHLEAGGSQT